MKRTFVPCVALGVFWSIPAWPQTHQTLVQRRALCRNLCQQDNSTDQGACMSRCLDDRLKTYGPPHHVTHRKTPSQP